MIEEYVLYQGRTIPKKGFRAYVYNIDNTKKLVESWEEYEHEIASGVWFSTRADVIAKKIEAPLKKPEPQAKKPHAKGRK